RQRGRRGLRLFVDRNRLRQRDLLNRDAILPLLRARGFAVIDTERLEVADQVALFAAAEAVVGIKGAGLVNTVFSPAGTPVVHLAPETFQDPYYRDIAAARGQPYHALYGAAAPGARRDHLRDFRIDPEDLTALLDRMDVR
ncbi:glycosyltransferase family 61 protein, partial [Methylobacterium hispanicum]